MNALRRSLDCSATNRPNLWLALFALGVTASVGSACASSVGTTMARWARVPATAGRQAPPPHLEETAKRVGEPAPDFTLPATTGEQIALSEVLADGADKATAIAEPILNDVFDIMGFLRPKK